MWFFSASSSKWRASQKLLDRFLQELARGRKNVAATQLWITWQELKNAEEVTIKFRRQEVSPRVVVSLCSPELYHDLIRILGEFPLFCLCVDMSAITWNIILSKQVESCSHWQRQIYQYNWHSSASVGASTKTQGFQLPRLGQCLSLSIQKPLNSLVILRTPKQPFWPYRFISPSIGSGPVILRAI